MSEKIAVVYGYEFLDGGFAQIPNKLIYGLPKIGVKNGEFHFVITLLTYKHDSRDPYPSLETLADACGCHTTQIKRWIKSLKDKGLLRVGRKRNMASKQWGTNVYSVKPMLDKILELEGKTMGSETTYDYEIEWEDQPGTQIVSVEPKTQIVPDPGTQIVSVGSEQIVSMGSVQIVSTKRTKEKEQEKRTREKKAAAAAAPKSFSNSSKSKNQKKSDLPPWVAAQFENQPKKSNLYKEHLTEEDHAAAAALLKQLEELDHAK